MLPGHATSKTVLLVDDDPVVRRHARAILEGAGFTVTELDTVDAALQTAPVLAPHLIILDLALPGRDGFAFLEQRRMNPKLQRIPVVVLSGSSASDAVRRAMAEGAQDYLAKPVEAAQLLRKARKHLRDQKFLSAEFGPQGPLVTAALPATIVSASASQCFVSAAVRIAPDHHGSEVVHLRDWQLLAAVGASADQVKRSRQPARSVGPSRYVIGFNVVGLSQAQAARLAALLEEKK